MAPVCQILASLFLISASFAAAYCNPSFDMSVAAAQHSDYHHMKGHVLEVHNQLRANYSTAPLKWNETLAGSAYAYARKCRFEHSVRFYPFPATSCYPSSSSIKSANVFLTLQQRISNIGENLAAGYRTPRGACLAWAKEEENYTPGEWSADVGHFTQMVWKSSTSVGCGWEECPDLLQEGLTQVLLVCHYYEQGNIVSDNGRYLRENVGDKTEEWNAFHEMLPESECLAADGEGKETMMGRFGKAKGAAGGFGVSYGLMILGLGLMPLVGMAL